MQEPPKAPYELGRDADGLVVATLRGYWTVETLGSFNDALDDLLVRHRTGAGAARQLKLLVDAREQDVQSREVIDALRQRAGSRGGTDVRVAVVVSGMLRKLQAERVAPNANRAVFLDEGAARQWLLSEG